MKSRKPPVITNKPSRQLVASRYLLTGGFVVVLVLFIVFVPRMTHSVPTDQNANDVPFTREGTLEFLKSDGSMISRLEIEIADDENQRQVGLMYRHEMAENRGMLFVFEDNVPRSFWMHNTYIPLDMIFIGADSTVVTVRPNTVPKTDDHVDSGLPARYVVETNAGYAQRMGIHPGDRFRLIRGN